VSRLPTGDRILLIDDEAQMRGALSRILAACGYRCEQAGTAGEGRELLSGDGFDLVICDLRVSEEGLELLDEIEHRSADTALLMVSGDPSLAQRAGVRGVSAYMIRPFSDDELRTNVALALGHAERKRRRSGSEASGHEAEMLERLNEVIASRDLKTGIHTRAVGRLSGLLAEACGLGEEMVRRIQVAAPMHDIGKIAMPDVILMKPSPLTGAERTFMERHAQIGHDLLAGTGSSVLDLAAEIALSHHEHFDGSGYPRGLAGDRIPLVGRIVAIADVFDALISDRPYRIALSERDALEEMLAQRGARFDPVLLDLFADRFDLMVGDLDGLGG
jgi:response regulator RpfG family c-di-GMP phosphodiesterase